ncbi:hypothetical protein M404DRAFT_533680 [Pisolithus tinctorius Marx 270]|uniref:Uncharacterized protein n=1 Tax=Pisolithus tinctorius Marx 270 TaxID=870435 RepID=A0A0C3J7T6_PISTI|nr:hypothetical protein M404DRAFT_533680 [Pisolithus tinctorius Marx 270]
MKVKSKQELMPNLGTRRRCDLSSIAMQLGRVQVYPLSLSTLLTRGVSRTPGLYSGQHTAHSRYRILCAGLIHAGGEFQRLCKLQGGRDNKRECSTGAKPEMGFREAPVLPSVNPVSIWEMESRRSDSLSHDADFWSRSKPSRNIINQ